MCSKKNSTPSVFTENASSCQNMELVEHVALVQTFPSPSSPCLTYPDLENIQTRHCSKLKKAVAGLDKRPHGQLEFLSVFSEYLMCWVMH